MGKQTGRPKTYHINLTEREEKKLKAIIRSKKASETIKKRCKIILNLNESRGKALSHELCAFRVGVSLSTVANVIKRYEKGGIEELTVYHRNENSNHGNQKVDGRAEAKLIQMACGPVPEGHSRWTLRLLEEKAKVELEVPVGKDAIRRALKKTNFDLTRTPTGVSRPKKMPNL